MNADAAEEVNEEADEGVRASVEATVDLAAAIACGKCGCNPRGLDGAVLAARKSI